MLQQCKFILDSFLVHDQRAEHAEAMIAQCVLKNLNAKIFKHPKRKFCQKSYQKLTYWPKRKK
jgi:hypothetical protein